MTAEPHVIPAMPPEEWNSFVADVAAGHAITSQDIPPDAWKMVFLPLALGGFSDWTEEELAQVGCLWERYSEAGSRSVNGYPTFWSVRMVNKEDWERAVPEINRRRAVLRGEDPVPKVSDLSGPELMAAIAEERAMHPEQYGS